MARPYGKEWGRSPQDRRRWAEGEDIRSSPESHRRDERSERHHGTQEMDFGGWRDREGGMMGGRWSEERGEDDRYRERRGAHDQGPGGGHPGGWGGTQEDYGSSSGGYGASGYTGSVGRWERGGAGYRSGTRSGYVREYADRGGVGGYGEPEYGLGYREAGRLTGRGPKNYRRSDDRIREDVCERIARSGINAEDVEVQVENGEVTLSGEVEHRMDKRLLEDLAEDVFGVGEVHDQLRLRRESSRASPLASSSASQETARAENRGDAGLDS